MSKLTVALKSLLVSSLAAISTLSSAYTPYPGQVSDMTRVGRPTIPCELVYVPGCYEPRPRWDDCPHVVRYEPGVWPHFPCPFPKPWDVIR
jgi:hypothetical protein